MISVSTNLSSCLTSKNMRVGFFFLLMQLEGSLWDIQNKSFSSSWCSNWQMLLWILLSLIETSTVCCHFCHSVAFLFTANSNCPGLSGLICTLLLEPTWRVPESCTSALRKLSAVLSKHHFSDFMVIRESTCAVAFRLRKTDLSP